MKYLHDREYYEDLYNKGTVSRCRWAEDFYSRYEPKNKPKTDEEKSMYDSVQKTALHYDLLFTTGERYLDKEKTVQGWIDRDTERQELYDTAKAPSGVYCASCNKSMSATFKTLYDLEKDREEQVLFMYDCPQGCMQRRSFFQDGNEWNPKSKVCSKCEGTLSLKNKGTDKKSIIEETCQKCGAVTIDEFKFSSEEEDKDFEKDCERFCLSANKGADYIETKQWFKDMEELVKEIKEKENYKDEYEAVSNLEKLTIVQVEKRLFSILEKNGYVNLLFDKPEIDIDVRVGFTINDDRDDRDEYTSRSNLKKVIERSLLNTNWRLMSQGISYRLGILTGRLRGYENEKDLLKLVSFGKK